MVEAITAIDISILEAIQKIQNPVLTFILKIITHAGDKGIIWFILMALIFFLAKRKKMACSMFGGVAVMQVVGNMTIKKLVARPRPFDIHKGFELLITAPTSFSFPSGHTASSFAASTAIFIYDRKWGTAAYIFSAVMGFSRLYFSVHYPTDVLAGMVLGIICGFIGTVIVRWCFENIVPKIPVLRDILK